MKNENTFKLLVSFGLFILIVYGFITAIEEDEIRAKERTAKGYDKEWLYTRKGVRYFIDCIENHRFIGFYSTHNYIQFAGPLGKCDEQETNQEN